MPDPPPHSQLRNPRLRRIAGELHANGADRAEGELRGYMRNHPHDAEALFVMAQTHCRKARFGDATALLEQSLEFAPGFLPAAYLLGRLLIRQHRYAAAAHRVETLLARDPGNPKFRRLKAAVLSATGEETGAAAILLTLAADEPADAELWIGCGDALRAIGQQTESLAAYRRAIGRRPSCGLAWWSLANMKTVILDESDIATMDRELAGTAADAEDRAHLLFALGKAHEDRSDFARAFEYYAKGNAARRLRNDYDWDDIAREPAAQKALFSAEFLKSRSDAGFRARDPIFILGRPRSGSTLVEQILSSHSAVEGTAELPYLADFAFALDEGETEKRGGGYPAVLATLDSAALTAMGESYMDKAQIHRRLGRPRFIDKAPANYHHIGLIALILPNAKIIDARRNPAACCLSMFKHNYTDTNMRLGELGLVWRNYAELTAHFDRVLPGRIHRVIYEDMVADPGGEIARLLDYLDLPFEENCLRFHETKRTVRSPSSEQVRRPISTDAVEHWQHFKPWLKPLLDSLGSALSCYPDVPEEFF